MNTLVRWNTLTPRRFAANFAPRSARVTSWPSAIDDIFASLLDTGAEAAAPSPIRLDVSEDDAAYRIEAVLAGVAKEDIDVSVEKNTVTISAEVKREVADNAAAAEGAAQPRARKLHQERYYGKTSRTFSLAKAIDEARIEASYVNGVLTLVLPKLAEPTAKRVTIN
jgi:HSP20 family protein